MTQVFESESYVLPSQVKNDVANRLKEKAGIQSVEMRLKGDSIEGGREFAKLLLSLKRQGVRITNEFNIRLEFPNTITREKALTLVENLPRPKNGSLKVRIQIAKKETGVGGALEN